MKSVEQDEWDIEAGIQSVWIIFFSVLYVVVMTASILMYLMMVRAMAITRIKTENVTYFLVLFLGFAALVEFAIIIVEFMTRYGLFIYTTSNCRLFTYTLYGNRILQVSTVLTLLYHNLLAIYLKTSRYELTSKRFFPLLLILLLCLELVIVIRPSLNMRASIAGQWCEYSNTSHRQLDIWMCAILLPYWVPLVLSLPPVVYLSLRLKEEEVIEPKKSQVQVSLAIGGGYFLFHLLYYILMTARHLEDEMERDVWSKLLGTSVWHITRPMFVLVSQVWHFMVPLACLTLDRDMKLEWPGRVLVRVSRDLEAEGEGGLDSIVMQDTNHIVGLEENEKDTELSPQFSVLMLENREFHNSYPTH